MKRLPTVVLLTCAAAAAQGGCPASMERDPKFILLAIDEGAPRPNSIDDFNFVNDATTFSDLTAKVGPPDAAKGDSTFVYCLADGNIVTVISRDSIVIRQVRVNGKTIFKRK